MRILAADARARPRIAAAGLVAGCGHDQSPRNAQEPQTTRAARDPYSPRARGAVGPRRPRAAPAGKLRRRTHQETRQSHPAEDLGHGAPRTGPESVDRVVVRIARPLSLQLAALRPEGRLTLLSDPRRSRTGAHAGC